MLMEVAIMIAEKFGFNVVPLSGKKPIIQWEVWHYVNQTIDDIKKMPWADATGVGIIAGPKYIRFIDIDKIKDWTVVKAILHKLGLPPDYSWVLKTGSLTGAQIAISVKDSELLKEKFGDKAVYKLYLTEPDICDHIELRWKECQSVMPPSVHPNGNVYEFLFAEPNELPIEIEDTLLINFIEKYCTVETPREIKGMKLGGMKYRRINARIDFERLEGAIKYLGENLPADCYEDWYRLGFALASIGERGRKYFVEMSLANKNYHDTEADLNRKFDELLNSYNGKITLGTLYAIAENYGWEKPKINFWYLEKEKVKISQRKFIDFLESYGFYKLYLRPGYTLIRIVDNVVEEIEPVNIKDFVVDYIHSMPEEQLEDVSRHSLLETIIKGNNVYFGSSYLEFLSPIELTFSRDLIDRSFVYYQNGFIEVTKDDVSVIPYKKLDGFVWKHQILNREFKVNNIISDFEKLLMNICKGERERFDALRSSIGYLLHTYKDVATTKAIVFIDEVISDGANGRSGKSLVGVAISKIRKTLRIDARNFNFRNTFAFQSVSLDTSIIEFNDVQSKFPFERLFSIITDGIMVEKKNKDQMTISFSESPKLMLSTNYTIEGVDRSTTDRQHVIEFSDFYSDTHRPINDFGKRFFENDWSDSDWNSFDNFMIGCIQFYLDKGLVGYTFKNLIEKKLIDMTGKEFVEFMDDLSFSEALEKKKVYREFIEQNEDYNHIKQNTFTKWIKTYCKLNGYEFEEWRSDKTYFFKVKVKKAA